MAAIKLIIATIVLAAAATVAIVAQSKQTQAIATSIAIAAGIQMLDILMPGLGTGINLIMESYSLAQALHSGDGVAIGIAIVSIALCIGSSKIGGSNLGGADRVKEPGNKMPFSDPRKRILNINEKFSKNGDDTLIIGFEVDPDTQKTYDEWVQTEMPNAKYIRSVKDLKSALAQIPDGKIYKHVVFLGHGDAGAIKSGGNIIWGLAENQKDWLADADSIEKLKASLDPDADVLFLSCNSGNGMWGFTFQNKVKSDFAGRTTYMAEQEVRLDVGYKNNTPKMAGVTSGIFLKW